MQRIIILGAAGRDFHNFNICFRNRSDVRVVAFTATQIPDIDGRIYPAELAGPLYPKGIPILSQNGLAGLIKRLNVDKAVFSYSDISHLDVMHTASEVLAAGAGFCLLSPVETMVESRLPVISVCAVRTGCGKSPVTAFICERLRQRGLRPVVIRHPMPYGDLARQAVQRYAEVADMDRNKCTIEEREEYEHLIERGVTLYAGVDYETILRQAENDPDGADVIVWDGGNNDTPFIRPDLSIVLCDPMRPGHETAYHPGETNLRMADVVLISKAEVAAPEAVRQVRENVARLNPEAAVVLGTLEVSVDDPDGLRGKLVLAVEDGPTLTHGGMDFGAAVLAAEMFGARLAEPGACATGDIKDVLQARPGMRNALPALGYSVRQLDDLTRTIDACECDVVLFGTPVDLGRIIKVNKPSMRVRYGYRDLGDTGLEDVLAPLLEKIGRPAI
ncbi:MAG: cyclic 2,3-diphosphoglycerate synthase [Desulfovibrio sp.]|uniref:cyclic 2,3-diphosphoglycerate synthase n=1 Tax=Desulfovibrio sp. 7SRBS1 TaxID=3378064 RepID=UPI003B3FCA5A